MSELPQPPWLQRESLPGPPRDEKKFADSSDVLENPGPWFFPPLASLITSAGRLLLAMTEACVQEKHGTYLFCDTDSLAIVSSENEGLLDIPGSEGIKILTWKEVQGIVDKFVPLNPYDPERRQGFDSESCGCELR